MSILELKGEHPRLGGHLLTRHEFNTKMKDVTFFLDHYPQLRLHPVFYSSLLESC